MPERRESEQSRWSAWLKFVESHSLLVQVLGGIAASIGFSIVTYLVHTGAIIKVDNKAIVIVLSAIGFCGGLCVLLLYRSRLSTWHFVGALAVTIFAVTAGATALEKRASADVVLNKIVRKTPPTPQHCSSTPSHSGREGKIVRVASLLAGEYVNIDDLKESNYVSAEITSCAKMHDAEVFFAGDLWSPSASYPGRDEINDASQNQCNHAFEEYVGIPYGETKFDGHIWHPNADSWERGDRRVVCLAYNPKKLLNYSIKGRRQ